MKNEQSLLKNMKDESQQKDTVLTKPIDDNQNSKKMKHHQTSPKNLFTPNSFEKTKNVNLNFQQEKEAQNKNKEILTRSLSASEMKGEENKAEDHFLKLLANSIDEKKLWREGYFRRDFNGDAFRVYNMLKASNVKICKKIRMMKSCEVLKKFNSIFNYIKKKIFMNEEKRRNPKEKS